MTTDAWGIESGYFDIDGAWHETAPETRRALRVAMGGMAEFDDPPPRSRPVWFVRQGTGPSVERPAEVTLEDGAELRISRALPPDLPLGYHELAPSDGGPVSRLIVVPDRCHLPDDLHVWGWMTQLYATRSQSSWGIGDLADLRRLGEWSAGHGAGVLGVNPLHAQLPFPHQDPSPYFPSSRRFVNPLYLRVEEVPGYDADDPVLADAAAAGRALNDDRLIDRDRVWALKRAALEHLWDRFDGDPAFDDYCDHQSIDLPGFASFCLLAEELRHAVARSGRPSSGARPRRRPCAMCWPMPTGPGSTSGSSGCSTSSWHAPGPPSHSSSTSPSASTPAGPTPGCGRTCSRPGSPLGRRPTRSTAGARTGASTRSCRGSSGPPATARSSRRCGPPCAMPAALRIDHVMGLFRLFWIPPDARAERGGVRSLSHDRAARHRRPRERPGRGLDRRRGPRHGRGPRP